MASNTRPSRLLNLNKSPTANKVTSTSNATNSPFLRLPAEIRHRIYKYALGGRVIHVGGWTTRRCLRVCANPPADSRSRYQQRVYDEGHHPEMQLDDYELSSIVVPPGPWCSHAQCRVRSSSLSSHLALHLLQICRQVYSEATLIPYMQNTFATRELSWYAAGLSPFVATLVPAQIRAISHLIVLTDDRRSSSQIGLLKLKGLKSLHLILSETRHSIVDQHLSPDCLDFAEFGTLSQLNLKSLRIAYTFSSSRSGSMTKSMIEETERVVERREEELLARPNVFLARKKAEKERLESLDRAAKEKRVTVREARRLRPLGDTS